MDKKSADEVGCGHVVALGTFYETSLFLRCHPDVNAFGLGFHLSKKGYLHLATRGYENNCCREAAQASTNAVLSKTVQGKGRPLGRPSQRLVVQGKDLMPCGPEQPIRAYA